MTTWGLYSAAELRDLVLAKDKELQVLTDISSGFLPTWSSQDPSGALAWTRDFQALAARYAFARAAARRVLVLAENNPQIREAYEPAEDEWNAVLLSLKKPGTQNSAVADLFGRLRQAGATIPAFSVPQPAPGSDADLITFNWSGDVLEKVDPNLVGKPGYSTLEKGLIALAVIAGVGVLGYGYFQASALGLIPRHAKG